MLRFYLLIVTLTALSLGGGNTLQAGLERELVQTGAITPEQFGVAMALGQATPGPLAAVTTAVGMALGGLAGAVVGTLALLTVSLITVWAMGWVPVRWFQMPPVRGALEAVGPLAVALLLFLSFRLLTAGPLHLPGLALAALVAVARLGRLPTAPVMVGAVLAGIALFERDSP